MLLHALVISKINSPLLMYNFSSFIHCQIRDLDDDVLDAHLELSKSVVPAFYRAFYKKTSHLSSEFKEELEKCVKEYRKLEYFFFR